MLQVYYRHEYQRQSNNAVTYNLDEDALAHQSVNVRLDRDDLLHIPSCLLVFSIELFFLC